MGSRKRLDSSLKISALRRHFQKKEPISEICQDMDIAPGSVYQWQETLFSNGHLCFEQKKVGRPRNEKNRDKRISELEEKLAAKNTVISELMEEILLEKKLGGEILKSAGSLRK